LVAAMREREVACKAKEARVVAEASELAERQKQLGMWQTQVERLASSLSSTQRSLTTASSPQRQPAGGVLGQSAAEQALGSRQLDLERRVARVEKMEVEIKRRAEVATQRAEALTHRAAEFASGAAGDNGGDGGQSKAHMNLELRRLGMQLEERRRDVEKRAAAAAALEKIAAERESAAYAAEAALESTWKEAEARLDADRLMWCVVSCCAATAYPLPCD
jgi:hypothetical protein